MFRPSPTRLPGWLALVANLVPLAGVLWGDWSLFAILRLYWLENAVIGGATLVRVLSAGWPRPKRSLVLFFVAHYGAFWIGHGLFLYVLFNDGREVSVATALASLALSHLVALAAWLRAGAWRDATPEFEMFRPYGRIFVLHIALLGGGWLLNSTGSTLGGLVLLVAGKTLADVLTLGDELPSRGGRVVCVPSRP